MVRLDGRDPILDARQPVADPVGAGVDEVRSHPPPGLRGDQRDETGLAKDRVVRRAVLLDGSIDLVSDDNLRRFVLQIARDARWRMTRIVLRLPEGRTHPRVDERKATQRLPRMVAHSGAVALQCERNVQRFDDPDAGNREDKGERCGHQ